MKSKNAAAYILALEEIIHSAQRILEKLRRTLEEGEALLEPAAENVLSTTGLGNGLTPGKVVLEKDRSKHGDHVRMIRNVMPFCPEVFDVDHIVSKLTPPNLLPREIVTRTLSSLARRGTLEIVKKGKPRSPAKYSRTRQPAEPQPESLRESA